MQREKLYFGHPVNLYNTPKEAELIRIIEKTFPLCEIVSPHLREYQEAYQRFKAERGNGMLYFSEILLPRMDSGIFLPFEDGRFGAGVFAEASFLRKKEKPIWSITLEGQIAVLDLRGITPLSIEETRVRVYTKK